LNARPGSTALPAAANDLLKNPRRSISPRDFHFRFETFPSPRIHFKPAGRWLRPLDPQQALSIY
jgi:hypothetical protein